MEFSAKSRPRISRTRAPASSTGSARNTSRRSPPDTSVSVNPTPGADSASRRTTSPMACASARSVRRNFSRAGVAKNRSRTVTTVPPFSAAGLTCPILPPSTEISAAASCPGGRLTIDIRATAPIDGNASPRNPKEWMFSRSDPSILDVACRASARPSSPSGMPCPSSVTRIRLLPPSPYSTAIRPAPASSAFSISSFTAEAGRSTTSPAAIRLAAASSNCRISRRFPSILRLGAFMPQDLACRAPILPPESRRCALPHPEQRCTP